MTYGLAEFAAAEELDRHRGYWWSPDSRPLLVARVDVAPVHVWYVSDPEHPDRAPAEHRYPVAGAANADVTLWLVGLDGGRVEVAWDRAAFEYVAAASVEPRAAAARARARRRRQDRAQVLAVDVATGATTVLREQADAAWVDVVPGTPARVGGRLATVEVRRRPLRAVPGRAGDDAAGTAGAAGPGRRRPRGRCTPQAGSARTACTRGRRATAGPSSRRGRATHAAVADGGTTLLVTSRADVPLTTYTVVRADGTTVAITSHAADPGLRPAPRLSVSGPHRLPTALLLPTGWTPGDAPLPVLMDPYGGPHHGLVHSAARGYLESQWWADQGFAVVVADGRGTPGSPSLERAVRLDLATAPVEDQVAALQAVAADHPGVLDLDRVAIRGWSFGGYLAALCVLRAARRLPRRDRRCPRDAVAAVRHRVHRAVPGPARGAPGGVRPRATSSRSRRRCRRPLLVIHGLADDNVAAANSLRLSSALLAAGRPHTFLPLSGVTHMTPQEVVAENLLLLQLDFLRQALDLSV